MRYVYEHRFAVLIRDSQVGGGGRLLGKIKYATVFFWIDPLSIWNIFPQPNHMVIPSFSMLHMLDYAM